MPATIFVVEDHDAVRGSLQDWLEMEFPGYRVIGVASGEEAVGLLGAESPCLVVMDISLPGMSGIEATRQIKSTLPSTQVVMLTIHESESYRTDATLAGASAYVSKRAMQSKLRSTLATLLTNEPA